MPTESILTTFSNGLADAVATAAPSIVQVQGRRRPVSGVVYANDIVVTSARALGRGDKLHVRNHEGMTLDAELAGWDPTTGLAVLTVKGLAAPAAALSGTPARVGHVALALARSWSSAVTASAGIVAIIGGPLATGTRRAIEEVIRINAPMHDGFAGGACLNTGGQLIGITTPATIRGLGVVIPAAIAWKTAASLLEHGALKRGYLGIAGQAAQLPVAQRQDESRTEALLVVGVTADSPAAQGGILVGDLLLELDGHPVRSAEDLLDLLAGDRVGRDVSLRVVRGATPVSLTVRVGERPGR